MRVGLVVVQYYVGDAALRRRIDALRTVLRKRGFEADVVCVDIRVNTIAPLQRYPFLDISGYVEGLMGLPPGGTVWMLNDTLFVKHPWRTYTSELADLLRPLAGLTVAGAAGVVKKTMNLLVLDEANPTRQHLSTFLLAMNPLGREAFERLVSGLPGADDPVGEAWLPKVLSANPALKLLMQVHFAKELSPWRWEGLARVSDDRLVQRKKVSVAFEYLFSREILRTGGLILPINAHSRQWIPQQLERALRRFVPWSIAGARQER